MKKYSLLLSLIIFVYLFIPFTVYAGLVENPIARLVALNKIKSLNHDHTYCLANSEKIVYSEQGSILCYIFELNPIGYIVVSGETYLPPIIAYSFTDNYYSEELGNNPLIELLRTDIINRLQNLDKIPKSILQRRNNEWELLLTDNFEKTDDTGFQQWPPEGTTSTGGWMETNWTQNAPYNNFCPMDPVTNQRSVAGCPAVAMAMIVNYYETINDTYFTDVQDDYYHSYDGRNYWIDDDYEEIDFPSFPILNAHLDTLTSCYLNQSPLKANEKAALTFACGVAATQVYTSSISGTFGVNQAFDAYIRFGFDEAILLDENDTSLYTHLSQNMMDARPVHLAVVDPSGTMGHNVVIDGYNTDDYYHLNFGWGGSYNGWYLLPDEIPYGLTVIEGAVANIAYPPIYTELNKYKPNDKGFSFEIHPNPVVDQMKIIYYLTNTSSVKIEIYKLNGSKLYSCYKKHTASGRYSLTTNIKEDFGTKLSSGIYVCCLRANDVLISKKFIVQ
jgi:hypothetical protein